MAIKELFLLVMGDVEIYWFMDKPLIELSLILSVPIEI
jgi:hypothetical protein